MRLFSLVPHDVYARRRHSRPPSQICLKTNFDCHKKSDRRRIAALAAGLNGQTLDTVDNSTHQRHWKIYKIFLNSWRDGDSGNTNLFIHSFTRISAYRIVAVGRLTARVDSGDEPWEKRDIIQKNGSLDRRIKWSSSTFSREFHSGDDKTTPVHEYERDREQIKGEHKTGRVPRLLHLRFAKLFFDLHCFVLCFAFGNRFMCFYYASTIFQFLFRLRHCEMCVRWTQSIECRIGRRFVLELTGRRYETTSALRIIFVSMKMSGILPNSSFDPHKCWPFAKFFRFDSFVYNFPFVTSHRRVLMAAMIVWPDIRYLQSIFISSKW